MALIRCSKCGKQFSEHALACPQCGASIDEIKVIIKNQEMKDAHEVKIASLIFAIVSIVAFAIIVAFVIVTKVIQH